MIPLCATSYSFLGRRSGVEQHPYGPVSLTRCSLPLPKDCDGGRGFVKRFGCVNKSASGALMATNLSRGGAPLKVKIIAGCVEQPFRRRCRLWSAQVFGF